MLTLWLLFGKKSKPLPDVSHLLLCQGRQCPMYAWCFNFKDFRHFLLQWLIRYTSRHTRQEAHKHRAPVAPRTPDFSNRNACCHHTEFTALPTELRDRHTGAGYWHIGTGTLRLMGCILTDTPLSRELLACMTAHARLTMAAAFL